MVRVAGFALVLLASAAIALGSPLCCLLGTACCGTETTAKVPEPSDGCCSRCKKEAPEKPAPKPCENKDCACKHDVASHAAAAEHAPFVAVHDVPAVALPERAAANVTTTSPGILPLAPARTSHPLLL